MKLDIGLLCEIGRVSRGGYYKWLAHSEEQEKDCEDYLLVKKIFDKGKGKFGFRTIQMRLKERKIVMNHKKIIRIMKKYNLVTRIRRRNPYKDIMKKSLEHRTFENKLNRQFQQNVPFKVFCTDITYLPFNHRFAYLSVVKDVASGEVVASNLSGCLGMDLVIDTVENLKQNKNISDFENILIHSDQGFHYTNPLYIEMVKQLKMTQSMSRKGNCIDNAPIESFFGHLKDDVDYKDCKTFEELSFLIAEYVKYYNQERQQWNLKKMTPVSYRNHLLEFAT